MNNKKQKKQLLKYARFSGIAFQLGATIYLAAYVGKWLDNKFLMEKKISKPAWMLESNKRALTL